MSLPFLGHTVRRRTLTSSTLFHRFPCSLFRWNDEQKKELEPVPWESEWERISRFVERRGIEKGDRRHWKLREEFFSLLKDDERTGLRRNPLRCELCRQTFPNPFELGAHLPCRANSKMIREGLTDRIQKIKLRRGTLHSEETRDFCGILEASISQTLFERVRAHGDFRCKLESTTEENFARFRNEQFLWFVARIRPELVDAENPTFNQRQQVARIQRRFVRSDSQRQKQIIVELFARESLTKIAKQDGPGRPASLPPSVTENPEVRNILERYEGKNAAVRLNQLGYHVPTEGKPMYQRLKKLRESLRVRSKKRVKSSHNKL